MNSSPSKIPDCSSPPALPAADFGEFYRTTLRPLRNFLSHLMRNESEAQDIAQDAYVKTYQAMHAKSVGQPKAYLFTTARRMAVRYQVRRASRMLPTDPEVLAESGGRAEDLVGAILARERSAAFDAAILALPPGCRQVLILQIKDGLSHDEIARRLEISPSTVAKHLARALRLLHAHTAEVHLKENKNPSP